MYKSYHNIGRRSAAEKVWTYKESDIAINDFSWAAIRGRPPKESGGKNRAKRRDSTPALCNNTETETSDSPGTSSAGTSESSDVSVKVKGGSPKKEKMAANIQGGRVDKDARRVKKKCVPQARQRVKRMACLNANAIVSLLYESSESSVKKSQRDASDSSKDQSHREKPKKETSKKEPRKIEATSAKGKGVGKKGKVAKVKKRRQTEADRLGVANAAGDVVPVKLARRMASLNASAILTAMSDKLPKVAVPQEKRSSAKTVGSGTCQGDTDVVMCTKTLPSLTTARTNVTVLEEKKTVIDKTVDLYSSVMDGDSVTFTGISDIKKMISAVTLTSTSPDVQITSVEPPKTAPRTNTVHPPRGVQYLPNQEAMCLSRQPTCGKGRESHLPPATSFASSVSVSPPQAHTQQRIASAPSLPPGVRGSARTAPCDPASYGHLQSVMPQMYFNPAVNYPSPGQPKASAHMINYAMVSGGNMRPPVSYDMMLMSDASVNRVASVQMAHNAAGMKLKLEKPCTTVQQASVRYNSQLFQPRFPQQNASQLDPSYSRSSTGRTEYGRFPLGGASQKAKLPPDNAEDKCHKKEFGVSCVDVASEKSLHSDANIVYSGLRSNFSTSANGGFTMEHREGAPPTPVIVMNSCGQGCTHERAHNSSLMGNMYMYPYPHRKSQDGADTHCQTYAVSDLGMSYEAVLPYPRSFGSAFTVPSFGSMEYPEDYSYFHSVAPDSCCLPHPLAAPHPQVKVLVHNSAGRQVVDQDSGLGASSHMLPTASAKVVIQSPQEGRLGQLTNMEKVGHNPQSTLEESGKELRRSTSNGNATPRTPSKVGLGQSGTTEKPVRKSDSAKVDQKSSSKKIDTPNKTDELKPKKDQPNSTNSKRKQDSVSKQDKVPQEPIKTKPKKDVEGPKNKKDQEGAKAKKTCASDSTKTNKDQPEAKKQKKSPEQQKKTPEAQKKNPEAQKKILEAQKKTPEPAKLKKGLEIAKMKKAETTTGGIKHRRDSAPKSPVHLKKNDKSAARDSRDETVSQRSRSTSKDAVKVTPGMKKKDLMRRSSPHGWRWQGKPEKKPVFCQVDQPPVTHDCYPSICHDDGDVIKVRDCVLVRSGPRKNDIPFIGKVASFWQNADNEMMMSLLWYYRPKHTETERLPEYVDSEIFASKHRDAIPVACIDDKCHVLTFNQYCRYRAEQCRTEQSQPSLARHVPKLPDASSGSATSMPLLDADPETVFLCRRVYDIKLKRVLKNPQAQWRDTPRLSSATAGSESTLSLDVHLMNSGSILAPASKNLSP